MRESKDSDDLKSYVADYTAQLNGPNGEDAFFSLIELDDAAVPVLIEAFHSERNTSVRTDLVEAIWQHRLPDTIRFLSETLDDPVPEVWQKALDGLVALGGQEAITALEAAKPIVSHHRDGAVRTEWIDEAIEQIRERH